MTMKCCERGAWIVVAALVGLHLSGGCQSQSAPAPAPAPAHAATNVQRASAAEPSVAPATAPSGVDYGEESHRLVSGPDEIISVLKNGTTVIVKRVPSPVVAVRAYVYTGGVYEGRWLGGGLSHLLEHLVAGCSDSRRSEEQNRDLLQSIGNSSNAETHADHTVFYVNTTPAHLDEAVDLVAGWMLGALIKPDEYRREYEVVQRELERDKGDPDHVFYELTQRNRYRVSPARVPTIGYQAVIQGLSRDDVYEYYRLAYQPNNMVWSIAGDADPEAMLRAVRKNVSAAAPGREFSRDIADEPAVTAPRSSVATFPKLGQARLELGFPTVRLYEPDVYALDLLGTIFGSGESSVLVEELRDRQGLVSGISAVDYTPSFVAGTFMIDMELDVEKIPAATKAALEQVEKLKSQALDPERIRRAKAQTRAARVRAMQTSEAIADSLANDLMMTGDPHFSDRYVERTEAVTAEELQRVAQQYLDTGKLLTTALLPAEAAGSESLPKAEELLRPAAPTTKPSNPARQGEVTRAVLRDGTVLLHKRITTTPVVSIQLYSLGGLTAEDAKTNGLGNLTMEMLSRGTKSKSAQQIAEFFDSIGGAFGASTERNYWSWSATCLRDDFARTGDVFAELVNAPSFPEAELGPMKERVLAAIESIDADWRAQATRFFNEKYFGPLESPYQFQTIGTAANVEKFTVEDLKRWYGEHVAKGHRVLAVYGDVDFDSAKAMAERLASQMQPPPEAPTNGEITRFAHAANPTPVIEVRRVEVNATQQPLAGVVIGFESNGYVQSPDMPKLTVADCVTSGYGYPTGYLFDTLRGRGLVYEVDAVNRPGLNARLPGTFMIIAGCDPSKVNEVVDLTLQNIARLQGSPRDIQPQWFERAKQLIINFDAMDNETPASQAEQAATDELYGLGYRYHEHFADRINEVTLPQLQQIARSALARCVVTVSTPKPDLVTRQTGMRTYRSFPPLEMIPRGVEKDGAGGAR
jgi:zinc protease